MRIRNFVTLLTFFSVAACTSAVQPKLPSLSRNLTVGQDVTLEGWLNNRGEILLFDSEEAMKLNLIFPYCVSALASPSLDETLSDLNKKHVLLNADVYLFSDLPNEPGEVVTRKILNDQLMANYCYGDYVLYIRGVSSK
jgi:hypothetical protein